MGATEETANAPRSVPVPDGGPDPAHGGPLAPDAIFDGHNDFLLKLWADPPHRARLWLEHGTTGHLDLPRMRQGGFAGGLFAIFVPPERRGGPQGAARDMAKLMADPPYDLPFPPDCAMSAARDVAFAQAGHLMWMERAAPADFALCRSVSELRAAMAAGKVAGMMHMEGAEAIDADLDGLHAFHAMGLRSLGPVWSRPTVFGHGVPFRFPGTPDTGPGLTEAGERLVKACNALGVMIDLSHLNEKGFDDVARLSDAPLVATHSNAFAICPSPRNLTDRQLAQIAESGGMVGLNLATFFLRPDGRARRATELDVVLRHIDHLIGILGEGGVGFGSDFDGALVPDAVGDVAGMPNILAAMRAHGYGEALIAKIARENWLDLLDRTLGR